MKSIDQIVIRDHCKLMQEWICDVFKHANLYNDQSTCYFLSPHQNQNFSKMRKSYIDQNDIDNLTQSEQDLMTEKQSKKKRLSKRLSFNRLQSTDSLKHIQPL